MPITKHEFSRAEVIFFYAWFISLPFVPYFVSEMIALANSFL